MFKDLAEAERVTEARYGNGTYAELLAKADVVGVNRLALITRYHETHTGLPEWEAANAKKVSGNTTVTRLSGPLPRFEPEGLTAHGAEISSTKKAELKKAAAAHGRFTEQMELVSPDRVLASIDAKRMRYIETGESEDLHAYLSAMVSEPELRATSNEAIKTVNAARRHFFSKRVAPLVLPILEQFYKARHAQADEVEARDMAQSERLGIPYEPTQITRKLRASAERLLEVKAAVLGGGTEGCPLVLLRECGIEPDKF